MSKFWTPFFSGQSLLLSTTVLNDITSQQPKGVYSIFCILQSPLAIYFISAVIFACKKLQIKDTLGTKKCKTNQKQWSNWLYVTTRCDIKLRPKILAG